MEMPSPPDVKPDLSRLNLNGNSGGSPSNQLKEAANKITLMSPDDFAKPSPQHKVNIKKEDTGHAIKDEIMMENLSATSSTAIKEERKRLLVRSGNSSPSREVQDILGDSEEQGGLGAEVIVTEEPYDDDEEEDDEIADIDPEEEEEDSDDEDDFKDADVLSKTDPLSTEPAGQAVASAGRLNKSVDWPGVPPVAIKKEAQKMDPNRQTEAAFTSNVDSTQLLQKMTEMTNLIQTQRAEIQALRQAIVDPQAMTELLKQNNQQISIAVKQHDNRVSQLVGNRLETEMRKVSSGISGALEKDSQSKVTKADAALKDAISKMATSRSTIDTLCNALSSSLQPVLQNAFKDALVNTLAPAFEKALQNMLLQLSGTFNKGAKDHQAYVKSLVDPLVKELNTAAAAIQASNSIKRQNHLAQEVAQAVSKALEESSLNLSGGVSSSPATPSGHLHQNNYADYKKMVQGSLEKGNFDEAFQVGEF